MNCLTKWGWLRVFILVAISIGGEVLSKMKQKGTCLCWENGHCCDIQEEEQLIQKFCNRNCTVSANYTHKGYAPCFDSNACDDYSPCLIQGSNPKLVNISISEVSC